MESLVLLIGAILAAVIAAVSYLFGRQGAGAVTPANTAPPEPGTAADIARLEERERTLTADIARQAGEIQRFSDALVSSQRDQGASRERLAAAEERVAGLARTLADERESNDAGRRELSADLSSAIEARDRLQDSFADVSRKLAAAEERAAGFQSNAAAEREGGDVARRSLSAELDSIAEARDRLQDSLTDVSRRLAAAEERAAGLQTTLSAERESNETARHALSAERYAVTEARDRLQVSLAEASQKLVGAAQMEHELRARIARAEGDVAEREQRSAAHEVQLDAMRLQLKAKEADLAASLEREFALVRDLAERDKKQLEGLRERLAAEFETIASRLLAGAANQPSARPHDLPPAALDPLSARIVDFQQKVQAVRLDARQSESARAIAEQAVQLYDALVAAVGELNDVSLKLQAVAGAHADATKKLSTGKGSAVSRAEALKSLGAARTDAQIVRLNENGGTDVEDVTQTARGYGP